MKHNDHLQNDLQRTVRRGGAESFVPPMVLRVEGLIKIYGKRRVVDGVSFQVNKGEIVGLLGPNGAGKTTSFRMACGLINTNGGVVYLGPHDVTHWPMYRRSREGGMGYLPQEKSVFQKLSVQNNLLGVMEMLGIKRSVRKKRCNELLEKLQLTHLRYNYAGGLSGGERRRLEIARSLVSEPKIILLDEPFAAVDPITVTGIQRIIRHLAEEGISILITDHSVQDTLQITQRSYVIQAGKVLCHGTPAEVLSHPEARKVYFGENVNVNNLHSIPLRPLETNPNDRVSGPDDDSYDPPRQPSVHYRHREKRGGRDPLPSPSPELRDDVPKERVSAKPKTTAAPPPPEPIPVSPPVNRGPIVSNPGASSQASPTLDEGTVLQAERINRRQHAVAPETKTRPLGRRLTPTSPHRLPDRPIVHSTPDHEPPAAPPMSPPPSPEEPAAGMSGIIRNLGSLIWKK